MQIQRGVAIGFLGAALVGVSGCGALPSLNAVLNPMTAWRISVNRDARATVHYDGWGAKLQWQRSVTNRRARPSSPSHRITRWATGFRGTSIGGRGRRDTFHLMGLCKLSSHGNRETMPTGSPKFTVFGRIPRRASCPDESVKEAPHLGERSDKDGGRSAPG